MTDGEDLDAAVRQLFGERWAATGVLDDVLVVAVAGATDDDVARLQALVAGAGVVDVAASRARLERWMDEVEQQLAATGELSGFLQMAPDGFRSRITLVVDAPVPRLQAWAEERLPLGTLQVEQVDGGT